MKTKTDVRAITLLFGFISVMLPACLAAQSPGRVEFTARVAPTVGQPEPVRQLTFYLLRKSLEDIRAEALQTAPALDLDKFVDGLGVSGELKTWMKKHQTVQLSGESFVKGLTPDDIVDVPEFFKAYMTHNEAFRGLSFPEPKFKAKDRESNPEKYAAEKSQYHVAVRAFITASPETVKGMDLDLVDLNPYVKWASLERKQRQILDSAMLQLAQERYVVARTDTDLEGRGSFAGLAPGNYWIGLFGAEAVSGDVHEHWNYRVTVRSGETASVELSNFNAVKSETSAQNSNN